MSKTIKVQATKHPVPREGLPRVMRDGRDVNAIHPGAPVEVVWSAYYRARVRAGELERVEPKSKGKAKE